MPLVSSGVEHGNLRELALARMKDLGTKVKIKRLPVPWVDWVLELMTNVAAEEGLPFYSTPLCI